MAISNRTRDVIERTIRNGPGSYATEIVTALNNASLNTTLSLRSINAMKKHVGGGAAEQIAAMLAAGSKANLAAAKGQDAWLKKSLWIWLKDRDAVNDVFNQIATVV